VSHSFKQFSQKFLVVDHKEFGWDYLLLAVVFPGEIIINILTYLKYSLDINYLDHDRIFGPIAVGSIYSRYGTSWTFGITCVMMILPMIWLYILRDRLDVESVDTKSVEMKNIKESNGNGAPKTNGSLLQDKAVIINENLSSEQDSFLINGK
jgi:hypothetical protein